MSRPLGASGGGHIATDKNGREWVLLPFTEKMFEKFQAWLENRARNKLIAAKEDMSDEAYQEDRRELLKQINAGTYDWDKPIAREAMGTRAGLIRLLAICLWQSPDNNVDNRKMTEAEVKTLLEENPDAFKDALDSMTKSGGASPPTRASPNH